MGSGVNFLYDQYAVMYGCKAFYMSFSFVPLFVVVVFNIEKRHFTSSRISSPRSSQLIAIFIDIFTRCIR